VGVFSEHSVHRAEDRSHVICLFGVSVDTALHTYIYTCSLFQTQQVHRSKKNYTKNTLT